MTVRTPLKADSAGNLVQMSTAEITAIKDRARWLYGGNPSVTLSRVTNNGNLGTLSESYMRSGEAKVATAAFVSEADTPEPSAYTRTMSYISETRADTTASVDTGGIVFPVFYDSGNLQAMTLTDFYDTFIYPAIDTLTGSVGQPGMFAVFNTSTRSGYTAVNALPIYYDYVSNLSSFDSAGIGTDGTIQQGTLNLNQGYYLFQKNNIAEPTIQLPVKAQSTGDVQRYGAEAFDTLLENCIRHVASEVTGSKITYTYESGGGAINLGHGMTDTRRQGDGRYVTLLVGVDDYRSQEFPSGVPTAVTTHYLRVKQT